MLQDGTKHANEPRGLRCQQLALVKLGAQGVKHITGGGRGFFVGKGMSSKVVVTILGELLELAAADGAETIAMPLFGGGGGLKTSVALEAIVQGLEAAGREGGGGPEITFVVRDADEFAEACALAQDLKAGDARREEENDVASDYLAELMAEMGDLGDLDFG